MYAELSINQEAAMNVCEKNADQKLIHETLSGDQEAFGLLMQKHQPMLYTMARRILKSQEEAEDVVQESFVEAFRHLAEFNHESQLSTWLYSIVLNRVRNRLRHSRILRISSLDIRRATRDGDRPTDIPDNSPSPEDVVQDNLERAALRRMARRLPVPYKKIFNLFYLKNCQIAEIAKTIGRPEGTVKVYLHRARQWIFREHRASNEATALQSC